MKKIDFSIFGLCLLGLAFLMMPPRAGLAQNKGLLLDGLPALGPGGGGAELCAAIHPNNPDLWLLGQDVGGVLKSVDAGRNWIHVNRGLSLPQFTADTMGIQELLFSPADPSIVFASTWGGLFRSSDTAESWTRVIPAGNDPEAEFSVFSCVAADPGGGLVLAGTGDPFEGGGSAGLYRSIDGGLGFSKLSGSGIASNAIFGRLAIDPTSPAQARHVYAATSAGLYRSVDGGLTFSQVDGGFRHNNVRDIALHSSSNGKQFWLALQTTPGGSGGVYTSADGLNWTDATSDLPLRRQVVDRQVKRQVFAQRVTRVRTHPTDPQTAWISMRFEYEFGSIYRTVNGGASWTQIVPDDLNELGFNASWGTMPYGFDLVQSDPSRMLVAIEAVPIATSDGGQTWRRVGIRDNGDGTWSGQGLEVTYIYDLEPSPTRNQRLYAAYEDMGLWRTDDGGQSWRRILWEVHIGGRDSDGCLEVHVNPADGDELYAVPGTWSNSLQEAGSGSWLFHSTDAGANWQNLTQGIAALGHGAAAVDFSSPPASRTLLFASHGAPLQRSTDGGATWTESATGMAAIHQNKIFILRWDPDHAGRVYAGTNNNLGETGPDGALYRSDDGGASWSQLTQYPYTDIYAIEFKGSPRRLFVGGHRNNENLGYFQGALMVSDDGGQSFAPVLDEAFVFSMVELPGHPDSLIAGAGSHYSPGENQNAGLYRSDDNGATWSRMPVELAHTGILSLSIPPWDAGHLYVGTRGDGLLRVALGAEASAVHWSKY